MRIPIILFAPPASNYAFHQRVPSDLQVIIGRKVIKQTRRTANVASARLRASVCPAICRSSSAARSSNKHV
ncbi:DUF6538 domain-containing protein [Xanthomonas sp. WHRI 10204]|uniref:DUF6538 domain-containing protein n=1 Tax=Xanthomonas sp. WHRI 10204 TaxID=3161562 RepID=UPI0032E8A631